MSIATRIHDKFYGLLEIDAAGQVLYSRIERDGVGVAAGWAASDVTGRNFYTEVAPFENVAEFRQCLDGFSRGPQQADSIRFTCQYDDGPLTVKMLLARIRERAEQGVTKSILVHIRKI